MRSISDEQASSWRLQSFFPDGVYEGGEEEAYQLGAPVIAIPRSRWYEDVTATYIRRAKIHSYIYAKHQYK